MVVLGQNMEKFKQYEYFCKPLYMILKLVPQKCNLSFALICGVHDKLNPQPNKVQVQLESSTLMNFTGFYQEIEPCSQLLLLSSPAPEPKS